MGVEGQGLKTKRMNGRQDISSTFGITRTQVGYSWRPMYIGAVALGLVIISYTGLKFGYMPYLERSIEALDTELKSLEGQVTLDEQEEFLIFYSQLLNLEKLLKNHIRPSGILEIIEASTLPQVYYRSLDFTLEDRAIKLEGVALDYNTVAQQLVLFNRTNEIAGALLRDANREKEFVVFNMDLTLKPEAIIYQ